MPLTWFPTAFCAVSLLFCLTSPVFTLSPRQSPDSDVEAAVADGTICGLVIDAVNDGYTAFLASVAHSCLLSVPFNDAVALQFVDYLNTTLQFQSTSAYLKNPPTGYQQPAVDIFQTLENIKQNISSGSYKTEYAFELAIQELIYSTHDAHVDLYAGIISAFTFASPVDIVSVSADGSTPPSVYLEDDVIDGAQQGWTPSPVVSINGVDVVDFLTEIALINAVGNLEPNADWNQLMGSPALDIQGLLAVFTGGMTFYPGGDDLNFTFANGSEYQTTWLAYYTNPDPTGPLTTGGDFYNYFVLGLLPAACDGSENQPASCNPPSSQDDSSPTSTSTSTPQSTSTGSVGAAIASGISDSGTEPSWYDVSSGAYPSNTIVAQEDLGITGAGVLTGYSLEDISTAVLSIPTFLQNGHDLVTFSQTVADFIGNASSSKHVIIDLQQNTGGSIVLALSTFKQFFPQIEPFAGSRRRSHAMGNVLGDALTPWWDSLSEDDQLNADAPYASNEWTVTDRLNAETGQNFSSWPQYYGPLHYNGDDFSLTERYNLSNQIFDIEAFDFIPAGYVPGQPTTLSNPWEAQDLIILTDGLCSSACSLFVEMMTNQAGVRTVAVGGRPVSGPMQAASGTRGALPYSGDDIDSDFALAESPDVGNQTVNASFPELIDGYRDSGVFEIFTGINLRDQVRENETVPLQFKYLAADCRLYYTLANVYNFSRLWHDAANAIWNDPSLCVTGSQGYATSGNATAATAPPAAPDLQLNSSAVDVLAAAVNVSMAADGSGLLDAPRKVGSKGGSIVTCPTGTCNSGGTCESTSVLCPNNKYVNIRACLARCTGPDYTCAGTNTYCDLSNKLETKAYGSGSKGGQQTLYEGWCRPSSGTPSTGC